MTIVALETSSRPPSIAVQSGGTTLAFSLEAGRRHASDLLGALESLLSELGQSPASIQAVIVGTGPGSYTGLRVGICGEACHREQEGEAAEESNPHWSSPGWVGETSDTMLPSRSI